MSSSCVWSSQPGPLWTRLVSDETPEVTSVAHASTGNFPFQHDILILMCSSVSRWEGEEKREEGSTWARFLGLRQDGPPSRHPEHPFDCSLIFVQHRALSIKKKWVHRPWLSFRGMIGRGCKFPLAEDESVLLDIRVHSYPPPGRLGNRDDTHQVNPWGLLAEKHSAQKLGERRKSIFFHPTLAGFADCVF